MAANDVYQVVVTYTSQNEEMKNVFYYRQVSAGGNAGDIVTAIQPGVITQMRALMHSSTLITRITVVNGMNNSDQADETVSLAGTSATTQILPTLLAVGLRSQRELLGQRYSYKRIGGIVNQITSDGSWSAAYRTLIVTLANELDDTLINGSNEFEPVQIAGGFRLGVPPTVNYVLSSSWVYNIFPTKQATRQRYLWFSS